MSVPLRLQFSDVPIYPVTSRLKVLCKVRGKDTSIWRTGVVDKWTPDGYYDVRFDGDEAGSCDRIDPNLQASKPGGVFRYAAGQALVIYEPKSDPSSTGWIEAEVAAE